VIPTITAISPTAKVRLPSQSIRAGRRSLRSCSRNGAGQTLQRDGVLLEAALGCVVAVFVGADGVSEYSVSCVEAGDLLADFYDLARHV